MGAGEHARVGGDVAVENAVTTGAAPAARWGRWGRPYRAGGRLGQVGLVGQMGQAGLVASGYVAN